MSAELYSLFWLADNVGDNVGDIAGMGSDLFGSLAESTCAALVVRPFRKIWPSPLTMCCVISWLSQASRLACWWSVSLTLVLHYVDA